MDRTWAVNDSPHYRSTFFASPDPVLVKIRGFRALPNGWSHGEGVEISRAVVQRAELLLSVGTSAGLRADAFPGLIGDVAVAFYDGIRSLEIVAKPGDRYDYHLEEGEGFQFNVIHEREDAPLGEALKQILEFARREEWNSLEYSASLNSISIRAGSQTSHSSIRPDTVRTRPIREWASRYSSRDVLVPT